MPHFSSDCHLMHLIRLLVFFAAKFNFWFVASHIQGSKNVAADAPSRNNLSVFSSRPKTDTSTNSTSVTPITRHHLDLQELDQTVQQYFTAGLAPSSHKTYQTAECRYLGFCSNFALTPLPTSEELLCYFSACLGQQGLAHTSIRTYLSGVRQCR